MGERKKVDRKRKQLEKKIEIYKKNNKAFCDMLALYSCFINFDTSEKYIVYTLFEEVVKDLEDKDVNVPFKAYSIKKILSQDTTGFINVLSELRASEYCDELEGQLHEDYRAYSIDEYYYRNNICINEPYDFFKKMSYYSGGLVSEILYSNIEVPKKVNILYDIIKIFIKNRDLDSLKCILNPKGIGKLARTPDEVKEQKINELCTAFKKEMDANESRIMELLSDILTANRDDYSYATNWLCYLQEQKLVDFMDIRFKRQTSIDNELLETSICTCFVEDLANLEKIYQLKDYRKLPEKTRASDDKHILSTISANDIPSFISLSNYKTSIDDIELIGKKLLREQLFGLIKDLNLIEQIKSAIIHKAKDKEEYKTYCKLAETFGQLADYKAYKKQIEAEEQERVRLKEQRERELLNARYEVLLRLYNLNESLQEQVPGKRVIKELVFKKENKDD